LALLDEEGVRLINAGSCLGVTQQTARRANSPNLETPSRHQESQESAFFLLVVPFVCETARPFYNALSLFGAHLRILGAAPPRFVFDRVFPINQSFKLRCSAPGGLIIRQQLTNEPRLVGMSLAGRANSGGCDTYGIRSGDSSVNRQQGGSVPAVRRQSLE